jgi:hypothetical protein
MPLFRTVAPYAQPPRGQQDNTRAPTAFHTGYEPDREHERPAAESDPQLRPFPSEQAALKVLYLAVRNLEEFRSPNVGTRSSGWKQALQAFTIYFDGRIPTP